MSIFDKFTNQYALSKTLRFELKPVGNTQKMLDEAYVFAKNKTIDDSYIQAKFYFDKLHQKFIQDSLKDLSLDFLKYKYLNLSKKKLQEKENSLKRLDNETGEDFKSRKTKLFGSKIKKVNDSIKGEMTNLRIMIARVKFNQTASEWKERYLGKFWEIFIAKHQTRIKGSNLSEILDALKQTSINKNRSIKDSLNEERKKDKNLEYFLKAIRKKALEKSEKVIDFDFSKSDLGQSGYKFILSSGVLDILRYEFPIEKEQEFKGLEYPSLFVTEYEKPNKNVYIFDKFTGHTGYLTKFQESRNNMYSEKDDGTAISNRIINENLPHFCKLVRKAQFFE